MFWRRLPGGGEVEQASRQVVRERVVVRNAVVELAGGKRGYDGGEEGVLVTSGGSRLSL